MISNVPMLAILDPGFTPRIDLSERECRDIIAQGDDWMVMESYKHNIENQSIVVEEKYLKLLDKLGRIPTAFELMAEIQSSHNLPILKNTSNVQSLLMSKYGMSSDMTISMDDLINEEFYCDEDPVIGLDYQEAKPLIHIMKLVALKGHSVYLDKKSSIGYLVQSGFVLSLGSSQNIILPEFLKEDAESIFLKEDLKDIMRFKPVVCQEV